MTNRMIIGSSDRVVDLSEPKPIVFAPDHRAFEPLVTYLTALHAFAALAEVYKPDVKGARPWREEDVALFDGAACDVRLSWSPHSVIAPMLRNAWPHRIEFTSYAAEPIPYGQALNLGVLEHFLFGLGQALLTNLVEDRRKYLKATYGDQKAWPPIWNFGRVIRNTMNHGGKVRICDKKSEVNWRRLTYSASDNGRQIINADIWPADIFILIKEMEEAL